MEEYFTTTAGKDLLALVQGDLIGWGSGRKVYKINNCNDKVLKFEENSGSFQNIYEWQVWSHVSYTEWSKWFAPCLEISPNGIILIQAKTEPIPEKMLPEKIPNFFTDIKKENWGLYEGRPVCHDYGYHLLMEKGMSKRLRKANW